MITIENWDKLIRMFRSELKVVEADTHYLIRYYYPTLPTNSYYRITLSRFSPPNPNHEHKNDYLMLCGEIKYWLSKNELKDINTVYEAIVDVTTRHHTEVGN